MVKLSELLKENPEEVLLLVWQRNKRNKLWIESVNVYDFLENWDEYNMFESPKIYKYISNCNYIKMTEEVVDDIKKNIFG